MQSNAELLDDDTSYLHMLRQQNGVEAASEPDDDVGFGWLRSPRDRAVMLELRRRSGNITGLGYSWLERAEFDPSLGITLYFLGKTVKIIGSNLNAEVRANVRLFAGILRHRVTWIQEADQATAMRAGKEVTVVERIEVK